MPHVYFRDDISLNPGTILGLHVPDDGQEVVIVAREITLDTGVFSRPVTLICEVLRQSTNSIADGRRGLTVRHPGPANSSISTSHGTVEPPVPGNETQAAEAGKPGFPLTVYARTLGRSRVASAGQDGGAGRVGRDELRNICETYGFGTDNPCDQMVKGRPPLDGPPGGPGSDGKPGGAPGVIVLHCVTNALSNPADWIGLGGDGGAGGKGGKGGSGAGFQAKHGLPGADGKPGASPIDVPATVHTLGEADWWARVRALPYATTWAQFRREQRAHVLREHAPHFGNGRSRTEAFQTEQAALGQLPFAPLPHPHTAEQFVAVVDEAGAEFDLDLVPEVKLYDNVRDDRADEVADALNAVSKIAPGQTGAARDALRTALGRLRGSGGSYVDQDGRANERLTDAGAARLSAATAISRCVADLGPAAAAGAVLAVPGVGQVPVAALVAALPALVRSLPAPDGQGLPVPSGAPICALPASPRYAVNRARRSTVGPFEPGLIGGTAPAPLRTLAQIGTWAGLATANASGAVDLATVGRQLRTASGDRLAHDLVVELTEAVRTWLLADLRIEQARLARQVVTSARDTAGAAEAALTIVGSGSFADDVTVLMSAAGLTADALRFHNLRAERAAELYTLGTTTIKTGRTSPLSEPELIWPIREGGTLFRLGQVQEQVDELLTGTARPALAAYEERGTQLARADAASARLLFVAPELPADPDASPASAEVFGRLRGEEAGFWFDAELAQVQAPHAEAKVAGVSVTVFFDNPQNSRDVPVTLSHQGFSLQKGLDGKLHELTSMPADLDFTCVRQTTDPVPPFEVEPLDHSVGTLLRIPPVAADGEEPEPSFAAYGRGVAAGWRFVVNASDADLDRSTITKIEVLVHYETLQDAARVNLKRVELASRGLTAGVSALGRVTLTGPAPAGGMTVLLRSSDPTVLQMPGSVTVPAGSESAQFAATALKATGGRSVELIVRTEDGATRRTRLPVTSPPPPAATTARIGPAGSGATNAITVVPAVGTVPERLLISLTPSPEPPGPPVPSGVHVLGTDLKPRGVLNPGELPRSIAIDLSRNAAFIVHNFPLGFGVSRVDLTTGKTVASRPFGNGTAEVVCDPAAGLVFVSNVSHARINVLSADDLSDRQVIGGLPGAFRMAVDPAARRVYVARSARSDQVAAVTSLIRRPHGSYEILADRELTVKPYLEPVAVALDPARDLVYVSSLGSPGGQPTLHVLTEGLAIRSEIVLPGNAHGLAPRPGTGLIFATSQRGPVLVDAIAEQILRQFSTGRFPYAVAVDAAGTGYVTDFLDHTVTRISVPKELALTRLS